MISSRTRKRGGKAAWQPVLRVAVFTVCLAAVIGTIAYWYLLMRSTSDVEAGVPVQVEIPAGAGSNTIGSILAEKGVVPNAAMFRLQARLEEADGKLRAGVYDLETGMSYEEVLAELVAGPPVEYVTVTIPEGFVIAQIASRFEEKLGIPADEFRALADGGAGEFTAERPYLTDAYRSSLEGYLFPKTYRFEHGTTAREAIDVMLDQFERELEQVDVKGAEARGISVPELVNIASMIERETKVAEERQLVSSVIYNRLEKDMLLQICATIEYVLPGNKLRLTNEDLKTDSPYNTYINRGLPPGPISNPGLASLQAAADPAETDYIYYVLTGKDGSHTFASNDADFLRAKQKSKEVFGE